MKFSCGYIDLKSQWEIVHMDVCIDEYEECSHNTNLTLETNHHIFNSLHKNVFISIIHIALAYFMRVTEKVKMGIINNSSFSEPF